jgi:hypothetical protein
MNKSNERVDGQNIIYHYIQKNLLKGEDELSKELIRHLLLDLSIWIPTSVYSKLPIILPYVVRDNSCRTKTTNGQDEWGSANSKGFLRDDNSLLKGIVRSFPIRSPNISVYDGRKLGTGFVASHIWGKVTLDTSCLISSRHYMLNSFVPNIVWLPVQISKLTDREGSYAQRVLQAISCQIYKNFSLPKELQIIWDVLPDPQEASKISINLEEINFFDVSNEWLTHRITGLITEIDTIISIDSKSDCTRQRKVKSSRYLPTLKRIPSEQRKELNEWLSGYRNWLSQRAHAVKDNH